MLKRHKTQTLRPSRLQCPAADFTHCKWEVGSPAAHRFSFSLLPNHPPAPRTKYNNAVSIPAAERTKTSNRCAGSYCPLLGTQEKHPLRSGQRKSAGPEVSWPGSTNRRWSGSFPEADGSTALAPPRRAAILAGSCGSAAAGGAGVSALPCPAQSCPLSVFGAPSLSASLAWPLAAGLWSDPAVEGPALAGRGEWGLLGELGERGLPLLRLGGPGAGLRTGLCLAVMPFRPVFWERPSRAWVAGIERPRFSSWSALPGFRASCCCPGAALCFPASVGELCCGDGEIGVLW